MNDVVYIEWEDSVSQPGWNTIAEKYVPSRIRTVGYMVARTPDVITIASSIDGEGGAHSPLTIPTSAVKVLHTVPLNRGLF